MTALTKNFSLEELCVTSTGRSNVPDSGTKARLMQTCVCMAQPLRDLYGKPIKVTSGYRSPEVNKLVGGSSTSQHTTGYALDIKPSNIGDMPNLMKMVLVWAKKHRFDQIIFEQCSPSGVPTWIHIGWKHISKGQRGQILTASKVNGKWVYNTYKH